MRHAGLGIGQLDLVAFLDEGRALTRPLRFLRSTLGALRGRLDEQRPRGVAYRRAALIEVRPQQPLAVQVDGEPIGHCGPDAPLTLGIEPAAVTMVTPPGPSPLFSR